MGLKYISSYSTGIHHEMINAAILDICYNLFDDVTVYSQKQYYERMKSIAQYNLELSKLRTLYIPEGSSKAKFVLQYWFSTFYNLIILLLSNKSDILIFNFNNLLSVKIINKINLLKKRRIVIFCHGELELIDPQNADKGFAAKILKRKAISFFRNPKVNFSEHIVYCVFGDSILNNLKGILSENIYRNFISIDHPYYFKKVENLNNLLNGDVVKLGTVGVLSKNKGLDSFRTFVSDLKTYFIDQNVSLSVVGQVTDFYEELKDQGVVLPDINIFLPRNEFEKKIIDLDYILFFYPETAYRLTASGAIMDAINNEKPIMALRNDFFEYFFEKFGRFGYLFDNVEEMSSYVKNNVHELNSGGKFDFNDLKNSLSIPVVQEFLKDKLELKGFL